MVILIQVENAESKTKKAILGKASLNLAEVAEKMVSEAERKLSLASKVDGVAGEVTLLVSSFFTYFYLFCYLKLRTE